MNTRAYIIETLHVYKNDYRSVRLVYKSYFFNQGTIFFSHNKSTNNTFSYDLSAKRTEQWLQPWRYGCNLGAGGGARTISNHTIRKLTL